MSVHIRLDGAWKIVDRPYVKRNGAWVPVKETIVKRNGQWDAEATSYIPAAVSPPQISLENVTREEGGNWIKVGVRIPGAHDPNIRLIRILSTYQGKQPTTQFGGTFTPTPDDNFPDEPWSGWQFDGDKRKTDVERYKSWPRSAKPTTELAAGTYFFSGWSQDLNGNWSPGVHTQITVPKKNIGQATTTRKEGRFIPNFVGSWKGGPSGSLEIGDARQQGNPRSRGVLGYGTKIKNAMNPNKDKIRIINSQIFLNRRNDSGAAVAEIYLGWVQKGSQTGYTEPDPQDKVKLGNLSKGEGKWFDLPDAFNAALKDNLGSFVLGYKHPNRDAVDANDFSVLKSQGDAPRQGEVHIVWDEF